MAERDAWAGVLPRGISDLLARGGKGEVLGGGEVCRGAFFPPRWRLLSEVSHALSLQRVQDSMTSASYGH